MSGIVVTELQVLDRLRPPMETATINRSTLPFLPKDMKESNSAVGPKKLRKVPLRAMKYHLSRSASLDRIRQFPAYLCSRGILPQALAYLQTSTSAVQAGLNLVRGSMLIVAVYACLFLLALQLSACFCALFMSSTLPDWYS